MDIEELKAKLVDYRVSDDDGYTSVDNIPTLSIDPEAVDDINKTLQFIQNEGQNSFAASEQDDKCASQKQRYNADEMQRINTILQQEFQRKVTSDKYQEMLEKRQNLPAWDMSQVITAAVKRHRVIIVGGMTGCGKTTQVPQFILDEALHSESFNANIICTQPRRIAATSIAARVAEERDDTLGRIVGYQIRLDGEVSHYTRLLFCTTGIVLRRLEGDPDLEGVTHIIVDEVHERSEQSDFLILVIKKLLKRRPQLRVILMSATIDAKLFSQYFDNCPIINIPGQPFLVKQFFLEDIIEQTKYRVDSKYSRSGSELYNDHSSHGYQDPVSDKTPDSKLSERELKRRYEKCSSATINTLATMDFEKINYNLIVDLLEWIVTENHKEFPPDGAILVFLPGYQEIQETYDIMEASTEFSRNKEKYIIIPLHSSFPPDEQRAVFHRAVPGVRKIVLSTNIAETSITIDDIVYVVDVGRMKEMRYDHTKRMQSLDLIWVTRTNAEQRKGRAGRVMEGVCFHLFTSHMYYNGLKAHPVPEIQRQSLEQVVIRTKILSIFKGQDVECVLQDLINPPQKESIQGAVKSLKYLGALTSETELTALGYHLGSLPVDVRIGKLMLFGAIFRCLDAALTIAAALSYKSPFVSPFKKKEAATAKKLELAVHSSDILTMLRAYKDWWEAKKGERNAAYNFCKEFFVSFKNLEMLSTLKQQFVEILSDIGFIKRGIVLKDVQTSATRGCDGVAKVTGKAVNVNNENLELLSAMLVASLYPNIIQTKDLFEYQTLLGDFVDIHPSSVNFHGFFPMGSFLIYHEKVKTSKVYIRECSLVSDISLLMFAGGNIQVHDEEEYKILTIDHMIKFKTTLSKVASSLEAVRSELSRLLSDKISEPDMDLISSPRSNALITCIVKLLSN